MKQYRKLNKLKNIVADIQTPTDISNDEGCIVFEDENKKKHKHGEVSNDDKIINLLDIIKYIILNKLTVKNLLYAENKLIESNIYTI